jgi:hypothetical protein
VEFVFAAAVGAVGVPVNAGEARGAFSFKLVCKLVTSDIACVCYVGVKVEGLLSI